MCVDSSCNAPTVKHFRFHNSGNLIEKPSSNPIKAYTTQKSDNQPAGRKARNVDGLASSDRDVDPGRWRWACWPWWWWSRLPPYPRTFPTVSATNGGCKWRIWRGGRQQDQNSGNSVFRRVWISKALGEMYFLPIPHWSTSECRSENPPGNYRHTCREYPARFHTVSTRATNIAILIQLISSSPYPPRRREQGVFMHSQ